MLPLLQPPPPQLLQRMALRGHELCQLPQRTATTLLLLPPLPHQQRRRRSWREQQTPTCAAFALHMGHLQWCCSLGNLPLEAIALGVHNRQY